MRLIFVRHGQTELNKKGILQGQEIDEPLNDAGRAQVEETVRALPEGIDSSISSPLKRAAETAKLLAHHLNLQIEFRHDLKELSCGTLVGKTWAEIAEETGGHATRAKEKNCTFDYRPYGGECAEDAKQRVKKFGEEIASTHAEGTVLIVAHEGIIDTMYALFPQKEKRLVDNASIHEFVF